MNRKNLTGRVKFISYDGRYPNLCAGVLVLSVDDKEYVFPKRALESGGSLGCSDGNYYTTSGEWDISEWPENFPQELKLEAIVIVNDNVDFGCCGGCS